MLIHFHSENHNTLTYGDAIAVVEQRLVFCSFSVYVGLEDGLKKKEANHGKIVPKQIQNKI